MNADLTEFLTPEDIANQLKVTAKYIIRKFEKRRGVVDLGTPETRYKRRYRILRIPRECYEAYLNEMRSQR